MAKKILIFSLGPIFKNHVHGGSQKVLREVAIHLGKKGHQVNIYCVQRDDNKTCFQFSPTVKVYPVLKFKQTFPASYKTSPHNLLQIIKTIKAQIDLHDVFYIHDGGLNFPFLCEQNIPTIVSLRDFLYPETLLGAFNFRRDRMIVNSKHTLESLKHTVGNYLQGVHERIEFVDNGFDISQYRKVVPKNIIKLLNKKLNKNDFVILYPHRPDPSKGIYQVLEIVKRLKFNRNMNNIKLLIPRYIDEDVTNDLEQHYNHIELMAKEKNIIDNIIFHKWIPYNLMPEYYSLGHLTLSIGNFIEAFGSNVGLESLSCETPIIMSLVGAQRTTLPEGFIPRVSYGDLDSTEKLAFEIIKSQRSFDFKKIREFISTKFSHSKMLKRYEDIICNTKIHPPLQVKVVSYCENTSELVFAPWCHLGKDGIYSDYEYKYHTISNKLRTIIKRKKSIILKSIKDLSIEKEVRQLFEIGVFVIKGKYE